MKHGKKYNAAAAKYDLAKKYDIATACKMIQDMKFAKFDETVEAHVSCRLEKNATVRDTLVFPNQFRGEKKVLVFCKEDKVKEAINGVLKAFPDFKGSSQQNNGFQQIGSSGSQSSTSSVDETLDAIFGVKKK